MRTLQYPEERINWLEEHKAIDSKLGDELRAFAAVSGMDGPAQMYGFTNDARVRSASITSPPVAHTWKCEKIAARSRR